MPSKPHTILYGIVVCPFSNLSRNGCIQNELSTRGTGSLSYDATSRGKDTPGDEWVYERLTAVRPIPYFRLKCVIFPGATFEQANNRAYFSPEALVSRGKMKKKTKQNKIKNLKKRKKRKYKYKPTSRPLVLAASFQDMSKQALTCTRKKPLVPRV